MRQTGNGSCIARKALAALLIETIDPSEELSLLISTRHGKENYKPGHAALAAGTSGVLIDSEEFVHLDNLATLTWKPGVPPYAQGIVSTRSAYTGPPHPNLPRDFEGRELLPPHYMVLPVAKGLVWYQEQGAAFRREPPATLEEYRREFAGVLEAFGLTNQW